jgi:hypothetical protein
MKKSKTKAENPIPKDAREVYCNEQGEPIAFCPKDSLGLTDIERARFYDLNKTRMKELLARANEKGEGWVAICIDVDDPTWTFVVDALMPGHNWDEYRQRGEKPVARGVVPRGVVVSTVEKMYPAALPVPEEAFIAVFAAGGIAAYRGDE